MFESGYALMMLKASWLTLQLAFVSLGLGLVIALIFAALEMAKSPFIAKPAAVIVTVLRGLPELLVVLFIFYGSLTLVDWLAQSETFVWIEEKTGWYLSIPPFAAACFALSLIFASYASQTIRGAIKAVPFGQSEAGIALGMKKSNVFFRLVLPQALKHALPGLSNQWLVLLKDTALVSLIGLTDLLSQAQFIAKNNRDQAFLWYAGAALIYLMFTLISQQGIRLIDKRVNRAEQGGGL
ncbi:Arginine ABC transporter permease protein ArtQ [Vibrio stylophorae]|uniref:Arginine ABC transporter permease protein ArtQ n=1 Tax=Vibrio stylophorae TaxID=659351 RepID=A0ABN8DU71_9VIBR|nr:arginine ABC transporter permease ArtQ [Vibrio stylophorae]CAH0533531.1 Arginine ABC transporter permease protein ArtQ [Vibrio stylophorae]